MDCDKSMKILVTGGSGFLAQRFIDQAHASGHRLVNFDLVAPRGQIPAESVLGDITDRQAVYEAFRSHQPEIVVHLATVLTDVCAKDPGLGTHVNCVGTANVFQAAREVRVRRVVYASSVAVFTTGTSPVLGDDRPIMPANVYGATKAYGEQLAAALSRQADTPEYLGLRFGWIYGAARDRGWRDLQQMIDDFLSGRTEVRFPNYSAPNDWTFVTDAALTILHCLTSPMPSVGAYNVSGDYRHVLDAVRHLQRRFPGASASPFDATLPPSAWEFQCDRLEKEVGYRPTTTLEEGLDHMIAARTPSVSERKSSNL